MTPGWSPLAIGILAASLAGCSGYSPKSNFILPTLPILALAATAPAGSDKSTVLISADVAGLTCAEGLIVLGRADATGFATAGTYAVDSQYGAGSAAAVIDLTPGTYHVVHVACRNGSKVVSAGTNPHKDAVPWRSEHWDKSLASFELVPGELLDVGELAVTAGAVEGFASGIDGRKATLAVRPSNARALAELIHQRPDQAPALRARPMQLTATTTSSLAKCRLVAPKVVLPKDGSSKVPDLLAENPAAKPVVEMIAGGTRDADGCVPESDALPSLTPAAAGLQTQ